MKIERQSLEFNGTKTNMSARAALLSCIRAALGRSRVVALVGPRQYGKTTLARTLARQGRTSYFDLEDPRSLSQLAEPLTALEGLRGLIVIDEVQRRPDLFPVLRVLADRRPLPARFLILGSASPALLRQSTESLAGRIETVEMGGFTLPEIGARHLARHWLRGGFPLSFTRPLWRQASRGGASSCARSSNAICHSSVSPFRLKH